MPPTCIYFGQFTAAVQHGGGDPLLCGADVSDRELGGPFPQLPERQGAWHHEVRVPTLQYS